MRMDAAVAHQPQQMKLPPPPVFHGIHKERLAEEFPARDHLINPGDVHVHDAPGAHVQMPDLAVPHLSFRQADVRPRGVNQRVGKFLQQLVVVGRSRKRNGISLSLGPVPPTVQHGQRNRLRPFRHVSVEREEDTWKRPLSEIGKIATESAKNRRRQSILRSSKSIQSRNSALIQGFAQAESALRPRKRAAKPSSSSMRSN